MSIESKAIVTVSYPQKVEIEEHAGRLRRALSQLRKLNGSDEQIQAARSVFLEERTWLAQHDLLVDQSPILPIELPEAENPEIEKHLNKLTEADIHYDQAKGNYLALEIAAWDYRHHFDWLTRHDVCFRYSRERSRYVQVIP